MEAPHLGSVRRSWEVRPHSELEASHVDNELDTVHVMELKLRTSTKYIDGFWGSTQMPKVWQMHCRMLFSSSALDFRSNPVALSAVVVPLQT